MKNVKQKLGVVLGGLAVVSVGVFGVVIAAQSPSVEAMERAYATQLEAAKQSVEALCNVEQSLAQVKLDQKGAAYLPVEELSRLQAKAKGENLSCRF